MPLLDALPPSSIASAEADADSAARCAMVCLMWVSCGANERHNAQDSFVALLAQVNGYLL